AGAVVQFKDPAALGFHAVDNPLPLPVPPLADLPPGVQDPHHAPAAAEDEPERRAVGRGADRHPAVQQPGHGGTSSGGAAGREPRLRTAPPAPDRTGMD